jgi:long-chain acyl-CoA synthetase
MLWPTTVEHTVLDLAVLAVGAVAVPVYETDSVEQVSWILSDSGATGLFVHPSHRSRVESATACWVVSEIPAAPSTDTAPSVRSRVAALRAGDPACIIYTSGTTGRSKGCVLTHGNLSFAVDAARESLPELLGPGERTVLFLPLAHVFARVVQYACLTGGVTVAYSDPTRIVDDLAVVKPTWLTVVPRVLEKVYASAKASASSGVKARIFAMAEAAAVEAAVTAESTGTPRHDIRWRLAEKLVYRKLRGRLGGSLRFVLSGGAPLDPRLDRFFTGAGVTVLEGYGLTESTAAHTVSRPSRKRSGSVGLPIPGVEVRVLDGEIQLTGPNIFDGYWNNPAATAETVVFDQGVRWLRTGDLGALDEDGFLSVTGRIKELIVTAGGKNVQPVGLEEEVLRHPAFSQCVVIGDRRPFIAALLACDPVWLATAGIDAASAATDPRVHEAAAAAVATANRTVSQAESIREWRVLPRELAVDSGELTATLKTRRAVVLSTFADLVEDIYRA